MGIDVLFLLQLFQVLFLALHDWVPLPGLNDLAAVRAANPGGKLFNDTAISTIPFALPLLASAFWWSRPYPAWLLAWVGLSYVVAFGGELIAWWIPYLLVPDPVRAARYQAMFGATHALLPARNGIRPNTLHLILHAATVATLVVVARRAIGRWV